jgi:hypothetical protein
MKPVSPIPVPVVVPAQRQPVKKSHLIAIYSIGVLLGALTMAVIGDVFDGSKPAPVAQNTPTAPAQPADPLAAPAPAAGGPAAIIANLGNASFAARRQAEAQLAAMGAAAIPHLQQAAQNHKDEEVRLRSQKVLKTIEAGEGVQVAAAGGGRAAKKEEEEEEEDPAAMMEAMAQQQMMEMARAELAKARAQMERLGLTGGGRRGAGGRIGDALGQMLGQQMGQLQQGVQQQNPNQEAPELPKLQLPQNRPPANNNPPPMQVDPPQAPAGGGDTTNLKSSFGAVFGNASGAVRVVDVQANTPASKAGLRTGDLITKINGRAVESGDDVQAALAQIRAGQSYRIELNRKGEPLTLSATR